MVGAGFNWVCWDLGSWVFFFWLFDLKFWVVGDGLVVIWVVDGGSRWAGGDFCQGLWVVGGVFRLGLWVVNGGFGVDLSEVGGGFIVGLWVAIVAVFLLNLDFWVISGVLCNCTCISCVLRTRKFFSFYKKQTLKNEFHCIFRYTTIVK